MLQVVVLLLTTLGVAQSATVFGGNIRPFGKFPQPNNIPVVIDTDVPQQFRADINMAIQLVNQQVAGGNCVRFQVQAQAPNNNVNTNVNNNQVTNNVQVGVNQQGQPVNAQGQVIQQQPQQQNTQVVIQQQPTINTIAVGRNIFGQLVNIFGQPIFFNNLNNVQVGVNIFGQPINRFGQVIQVATVQNQNNVQVGVNQLGQPVNRFGQVIQVNNNQPVVNNNNNNNPNQPPLRPGFAANGEATGTQFVFISGRNRPATRGIGNPAVCETTTGIDLRQTRQVMSLVWSLQATPAANTFPCLIQGQQQQNVRRLMQLFVQLLGLYPEIQRSDRNTYVNLQDNAVSNNAAARALFAAQPPGTGVPLLTMDCNSITMYDRQYLSLNGQQTYTVNPGQCENSPNGPPATQTMMTQTDCQAIAALYRRQNAACQTGQASCTGLLRPA